MINFYYVKRKGLQLLTLQESGVQYIIVKTENTVTKKLPRLEKFFDIIISNHVKEACHRGIKATYGTVNTCLPVLHSFRVSAYKSRSLDHSCNT